MAATLPGRLPGRADLPRCPGSAIYEGTSDIQRLIIARELAKSYADHRGIGTGSSVPL